MAIIDKPLRVPVLDGAVLFSIPLHNEWALEIKRAEELKTGDKTLDQQIDEFLAKAVGVENFFWADGTPYMVDDLRAKKYPEQFIVALFEAYPEALKRMFREDAAKNGSTPA